MFTGRAAFFHTRGLATQAMNLSRTVCRACSCRLMTSSEALSAEVKPNYCGRARSRFTDVPIESAAQPKYLSETSHNTGTNFRGQNPHNLGRREKGEGRNLPGPT